MSLYPAALYLVVFWTDLIQNFSRSSCIRNSLNNVIGQMHPISFTPTLGETKFKIFGVWNPMNYFKGTLPFNHYARLSSYGIVKPRREFSLYTYNENMLFLSDIDCCLIQISHLHLIWKVSYLFKYVEATKFTKGCYTSLRNRFFVYEHHVNSF